MPFCEDNEWDCNTSNKKMVFCFFINLEFLYLWVSISTVSSISLLNSCIFHSVYWSVKSVCMRDRLAVWLPYTTLHMPRNMLVEDFEHETHSKSLSLHDVWKSDPCKIPHVRCERWGPTKSVITLKKCISPYKISISNFLSQKACSLICSHWKIQIMGLCVSVMSIWNDEI